MLELFALPRAVTIHRHLEEMLRIYFSRYTRQSPVTAVAMSRTDVQQTYNRPTVFTTPKSATGGGRIMRSKFNATFPIIRSR